MGHSHISSFLKNGECNCKFGNSYLPSSPFLSEFLGTNICVQKKKKKKNQQLELSTITMHQAETLNPLPGQLTESLKSAYATLLLLSSLSRVKGKRKHQLRPGTIG